MNIKKTIRRIGSRLLAALKLAGRWATAFLWRQEIETGNGLAALRGLELKEGGMELKIEQDPLLARWVAKCFISMLARSPNYTELKFGLDGEYRGKYEWVTVLIKKGAGKTPHELLQEAKWEVAQKLAACDCAAIGDTEDSHAKNKSVTKDSPFWSPAFNSVMRITGECITLRAEVERLRRELGPLREFVGVRFDAESSLSDIANWVNLVGYADDAKRLRAELGKVYALVAPEGCDLAPGGIFETVLAVEELKHRCQCALRSWDEERERAQREGKRVVELSAEVERLKHAINAIQAPDAGQ